MPMQGALTVERMCYLAGVSRAGFYRFQQEKQPLEEELELRSMIQQIALEHHRRYGYRRISAELRRRGRLVNHKRVARIMREDNLLAVQPRAFHESTDSEHELRVYLNLARRLQLSGADQLWVADITYIRLQREFVYLALVLDAWSRKVIGWALERTLTTRLPRTALEQAIQERQPQPGLVHHSDRGIQYASAEYVGVLAKYQMTPSMSRPANPYDNATCESFIRTLKREEIDAREYRDLKHLRETVAAFIDSYYNRVRLHSALGYRSPEEFERTAAGAASMSFFRHEEIYRSDLGPKRHGKQEPVGTRFPDHRLDESPVGYSLAGWSPPEPASASPAKISLPHERQNGQ
jgi:putative transposase